MSSKLLTSWVKVDYETESHNDLFVSWTNQDTRDNIRGVFSNFISIFYIFQKHYFIHLVCDSDS